jgi:membrane protease YdiL (CAAX protease family)
MRSDLKPASVEFAVGLFLLFCISGWVAVSTLGVTSVVVQAEAYRLLFLPFAFVIDPQLLSADQWGFPRNGWLGIVAITLLQFGMSRFTPALPVGAYRLVSACVVAPVVEEVIRAVMMRSMTHRFGSFCAVVSVTLVWASVHDWFWVAMLQQLTLCTVYVKTRNSLPAAIAAHFAMNVVVAGHHGWR